MAERRRQPRVIPGFGLSLGYTMLYLSLMVLIPLSAIFIKSATLSWAEFTQIIRRDQVIAAFCLSFGAALVAALINVCIGLLVAWVLTRYRFFGRRFLDALIDLPFALPTAVAGIALVTLYRPRRGGEPGGWLGGPLSAIGFSSPWPVWHGFSAEHPHWPFGLKWFAGVSYTPLGVVMALIFIGLPFVVRTIQPVLQDLGRETEEAAGSLGASRWQTFRKVTLPEIMPALVTGFALAMARGLGEYGSVVLISGNRSMETEIVPNLIVNSMEGNHDVTQATAIAMVMLVVSFVILLLLNLVQRWFARKGQA